MSLTKINVKNYYLINTLSDKHCDYLENKENFEKFKKLFVEKCDKKGILYIIGLGNNFIDDLIEIDSKDTKDVQEGVIEYYKYIFDEFQKLNAEIKENFKDHFEPCTRFPILFSTHKLSWIENTLKILNETFKESGMIGLEYGDINNLLLYKNEEIGDTMIITACVDYP